MGHSVGRIFKAIAPIALPILGTLVAPGLGTALGSTLGASTLGAIGGGLGGAGGGLIGGGKLSSVLKGAALGAGGGYLSSGGAGELLGGTQLGNTLGLSAPEGGSVIGNAIGSVPGSTATLGSSLSSILSGSGIGAASGSGAVPTSFPSPASAISGASAGSAVPSLVNADSALTGAGSGVNGAGFNALTKAGSGIASGGGLSSYGTLAALAGGANSLLANDQAQKDLLDAQRGALGQVQPYTATGTAANAKLSELLGTGGNKGATDYGSLTKPFTPGDLTQDPGYQFDLTQGNQALDRKQASAGNYFSGAALKAAQDYGQGLADNTYNNAFQRSQTQKQQTYGALAGASGTGLSAANTAAGIYDNTGNAKANAGISSSNILNSTLSSLLSGSGAKKPTLINGQVVYI